MPPTGWMAIQLLVIFKLVEEMTFVLHILSDCLQTQASSGQCYFSGHKFCYLEPYWYLTYSMRMRTSFSFWRIFFKIVRSPIVPDGDEIERLWSTWNTLHSIFYDPTERAQPSLTTSHIWSGLRRGIRNLIFFSVFVQNTIEHVKTANLVIFTRAWRSHVHTFKLCAFLHCVIYFLRDFRSERLLGSES